MKKAFLFTIPLLFLAGCGSDEMSKSDEAKVKASLSKGGDASAMTPEEKARMEEYMKKNMGGSGPK